MPIKRKKNLPIGYHTSRYIHTHHKYILFLKEIILYAKPPIGENTVIVVIFIAHPPIDNPEKSILIKKYWSWHNESNRPKKTATEQFI